MTDRVIRIPPCRGGCETPTRFIDCVVPETDVWIVLLEPV